MKPVLNIAAHLAIGIAAFFLMASIKKLGGAGNAEPVRPTRPGDRAQPAAADKPGPDGKSVKIRMKAADYQAAWDAIAARKWSKTERVEYQIKLLKEWAATDLEGALKAAFSETWNRGNVRMAGENFTFQRAFAEVFVDRSEDVLKLIQQRKTGILESSLLLEAWSSTLLNKDRDLYLGYLRTMDGGDFGKTLAMATRSARSPQDKQFLTQILDAVAEKQAAGIAVEGLNRSFYDAAVNVFSKDDLMEKLRNSSGEMTGFYGSLMAMNFAGTHRDASAEQVAAEIDSLPDGNRGPFARALLDAASRNPAIVQTALDHLVATEQWQLLDKDQASDSVRTMSRTMDPVNLAEWAVNLPPREETTEMFHRGVEPYIRKSPEDAWSWIEQMDAGYWRDHALAEYSQVNLHVFNDPAKSAAAIAQIRDPAFLETVKGWRASWEKQKGR